MGKFDWLIEWFLVALIMFLVALIIVKVSMLVTMDLAR